MRPIFFICSFTFLLFFFITFSPSTSHNIIQETCQQFAAKDPNINYTFCTTSLQAAPDSDWADLFKLGTISFNLIRKNVTSTSNYIKKLLKNEELEPYVMACLNDCLELYSDSLLILKEANDDYKYKHYQDANIKASSVMDASVTCEDGFKEKEGVASVLTYRNNNAFQLTAITLSIIYQCSSLMPSP